MQEKFKYPQNAEEFKKRADPVTVPGASSVLNALEQRLEKVAGPLKAEIQFFKDAIEYKKTGKLPERLANAETKE